VFICFKQEEEHKDIEHFWYKKWGAYQLPRDTSGIIAFLQEIYEVKRSKSGPMVVHCRYLLCRIYARLLYIFELLLLYSDGLGRSGALIATDIARQQLESETRLILRILLPL